MNYCTLFNSYYLSRGLALYYSLLNHAEVFHLFIFAFDDKTYQILNELNLEHATIISLREFETPQLLKVKKERTIGEYCWTCTAAITLYCLEKFSLPDICYLDADLFFWQDPKVLLAEATNASILITEHHYTPDYDHSLVSGKYCVQFMYFKNDPHGKEALAWWRDACIEWCYDRVEAGKFGDQKYLDDWLERFQQVKVLQHLGGGVAPWNVQQYDFADDHSLLLKQKTNNHLFDLVFYHFHALKFVNNNIDFGTYKLTHQVVERIYRPYVQQLLTIEQTLREKDKIHHLLAKVNLHGKIKKGFSVLNALKKLKKYWLGIYNVHSIENFKS